MRPSKIPKSVQKPGEAQKNKFIIPKREILKARGEDKRINSSVFKKSLLYSSPKKITGLTLAKTDVKTNFASTGKISKGLATSLLFKSSLKLRYSVDPYLKDAVKYSFTKGSIVCEYLHNPNKNWFYVSKLGKNYDSKSNPTKLLSVFEKIYKNAKELNVKEIYCNSWIFFQHPLLTKRLGFKIHNLSQLKKFESKLKLNKVSKIIGYDFKNGTLKCYNKNNQIINLKTSKFGVSLPLWKKEM